MRVRVCAWRAVWWRGLLMLVATARSAHAARGRRPSQQQAAARPRPLPPRRGRAARAWHWLKR